MKVATPATGCKLGNADFDKKFGIAAYLLLLLAIVASTWLHHREPQVLRVPSNADLSSWVRPTFEQTVLHDHLTADEKARLLSEGVPLGQDWLSLVLSMDLFTVVLGGICFRHAVKHFGFWMASCFLIGSFVFTGLEESMWILLGRNLPEAAVNPLGEAVHGTYWFTKGGFWFLETPITACIGWFFIAYSCVLVAGKVFAKRGPWFRAAVGGLIAMGIDLWMDPVATSPETMNWVWAKGDVFLLFGIPHTNFIGWFLLIFLFALFWEKLPSMEARWGRPRASAIFFIVIFATEMGILVFFVLWIAFFGWLLSLLGAEQAIRIPGGW